MLIVLKKSIVYYGVLFRALEVGMKDEHNLSIIGGNWEGIIGDRLHSRKICILCLLKQFLQVS